MYYVVRDHNNNAAVIINILLLPLEGKENCLKVTLALLKCDVHGLNYSALAVML